MRVTQRHMIEWMYSDTSQRKIGTLTIIAMTGKRTNHPGPPGDSQGRAEQKVRPSGKRCALRDAMIISMDQFWAAYHI
mgnify:CR=1 FL=1